MRFGLASFALIMVIVFAPIARAIAETPDQLCLLNCWGCHRANGEGIPGTAPPLKASADFLRVQGGRAYLIQVPGVSQSALNDAQIAAVMNWIIGSFGGGTPFAFAPYMAAEVKKYRAWRDLHWRYELQILLTPRFIDRQSRKKSSCVCGSRVCFVTK